MIPMTSRTKTNMRDHHASELSMIFSSRKLLSNHHSDALSDTLGDELRVPDCKNRDDPQGLLLLLRRRRRGQIMTATAPSGTAIETNFHQIMRFSCHHTRR